LDGTGGDGGMIGRAAIGNPWIFEQSRNYLLNGEIMDEPTFIERLEMCAEQLKASVTHHGERFGVIMMKKHYGNYLKGIRNSKHMRMALMEPNEMIPILELLEKFKIDLLELQD